MKACVNILTVLFLLTSCANIVAPTGGDQDISAPRLLNVEFLQATNDKKTKTIIFEFDEYIQLNNFEDYFYISPPLQGVTKKQIKGKDLYIFFDDILDKKTTYQVVLDYCVMDYNEGNILDTLSYIFTLNDTLDTLTLSGRLEDAYTLNILDNIWVMLFNEDTKDSLIFNSIPDYISKTDKNGFFHFPNLKNQKYKITALTDYDFFYNNKEKIAFSDSLLNPKIDSFIVLSAFDPLFIYDSLLVDSIVEELDSIINFSKDTISKEQLSNFGSLEIYTNKNSPCIFQLLQKGVVKREVYFIQKPYVIRKIKSGIYDLKYISDNNQDSVWNTGDWSLKIQPEKVVNYPAEINIRSNWDLELDWTIEY